MGFHLKTPSRSRPQHQFAVQILHSLAHSGQAVARGQRPVYVSVICNLNDQDTVITLDSEPKIPGLGMFDGVGHRLLNQPEEGRGLARRWRCTA